MPEYFFDYETTPRTIAHLINSLCFMRQDNNVERYMSLFKKPTIPTKAITIYDEKRYNTNEYEYEGDMLLSVDMSKTDTTILNDIKLLIKRHRNRKSCLEDTTYINSEKAEIMQQTKTKLSFDDLGRRLIGLYLYDHCYLFECGGPTAIKALSKEDYLERLGLQSLLNDPQYRQLLRLLANAKQCIESANVKPIVSR